MAAHGRLVDGGTETTRGHGCQNADKTGPGDIEISAIGVFLPGNHNIASQTVQRPVQRTQKARTIPGRVGTDTGGATPFKGKVQHIGARMIDAPGNLSNFMLVGVSVAGKPSAGGPVPLAESQSAIMLAADIKNILEPFGHGVNQAYRTGLSQIDQRYLSNVVFNGHRFLLKRIAV